VAIKEDVRDFDSLITAHADYVNALTKRAFLHPAAKVR